MAAALTTTTRVLEYCALSLLAEEQLYGFDLVRRFSSVDGMITGERTIHPLLSRLRRDGWVTTTWSGSESGPPRRYYSLTDGGRSALSTLRVTGAGSRDTVDPLLPQEST